MDHEVDISKSRDFSGIKLQALGSLLIIYRLYGIQNIEYKRNIKRIKQG